MAVSLEEVEKLYEERVKVLQAETGYAERQKIQIDKELKKATDELETTQASISSANDELTKLKAQKKLIEDLINTSQKKSIDSLEAKEKSVNARIELAEKAESKLKAEKIQAGNAYSKMYGLGKDVEKLAGVFVEKAQAALDGIKADISTFPQPDVQKESPKPEIKK